MPHFRAQNGPFVLNKNFLVQTIVITFIYLLAFFIVQNPELWRSTILGHQNGPFAPNNFFFLENYYYHSHLPITPFHCAKLKKILPADSELWEYAIFGPISPTEHFFFFRKAGNEPCFFYSCLSTCQKSKSDINLLVEY